MNAILLLLTTTGCDLDSNADTAEERPPLSDWTEGFESDDEPETLLEEGVNPSDDTKFSVFPRTDLPYEVRLNEINSADTPCAVDIPDTFENYEGMDCIYEIPELDLYGNNFTFDVYVPASACQYLVYDFYMYEAFETGVGSVTASYTVTPENVIIPGENVDDSGTPICAFDYVNRGPDYPNCCLGSYDLTITIQSEDGPDQVETITRAWGGDESECYDGAAYYDVEATFDQNGFPTSKIVYLDGGAFSKRFEWNLLSERYGTNVPLSNYYDPADHNGNKPAGLLGSRAREFYSFRCYDNAEELLAKIDLVVREWNAYDEFLNSGDPNTEGTEQGSQTPINDRLDWADATPGDQLFIEFGQ